MSNQDNYLLQNTPQWWSMVSLPYPFDPTAECPRWDAFLEYNLELDPERIKLVQEWAGYLLLSTTDEQKFMILEGEGKNGKGVFIAGLTAMLGEDNVSNVSLENFGNRFQLTDTIGKLLNAAGDCGDIDKTAEGTLKSFTSGDRMYFDRKGIPGLNCIPTARLMIACNNRPRFSDRSDGIYRRMISIPWQVAISEGKRVKGMDKVSWWQKSGELPGIFRWALVGLARLRAQNGFTESEVCNRALDDYRAEMNPARAFLEELYAAKPTGQVLCCELYDKYQTWCNKNGHSRPLSERQFGKEIKRKFPSIVRERETTGLRQWYYGGIEQIETF
jgi:putative DNA primase/helicase